jgi:transcriptional regulator with XRE-family HTH domain
MEAVAQGLRSYRDGNNPERRVLTNTEVAARLGVSKPSISKYLRAKLLIGGETLARLVVELGVMVTYRGKEISARDFAASGQKLTEQPAEQISFLFEMPCLLEETAERVAVTVARKDPKHSQVTVEVRVAS